MMFAGMVHADDRRRFGNELIIEGVRASRHSHQVSRLTGVFFFTDEESAVAAEKWGEPFQRQNLTEVVVQPVGYVTRVDSEWITQAPCDAKGQLDTSDLSWVDRYWSGESQTEEALWETIAHGKATVLGTELRQRAYRVIANRFPSAVDMLEISRLAAAVDGDLGQAVALMRSCDSGKVRLDYFLDMRQAGDPAFLARLAEYNGPKNIRDLQRSKETFDVPDFRQCSCEFTTFWDIDQAQGDTVRGPHRMGDI